MSNQAKRPRILYVEKPPFVGGSITGLYETVKGIVEHGHYEPIILFHGPNPYREHFEEMNVRVLVLDDSPPQPPIPSTRDIAATLSQYGAWLGDAYRAAKKAYLIFREDRPLARQVAHIIRAESINLVHHNNHLEENRATVLAARMAGIPQICHVRMLLGFDWYERFLARPVNKFIYMSTAIEKRYQNLGIPAKQGQVIYDAFELTTTPHNTAADDLRREFGLTKEDYLVSNVGRFDWWKGQDYFIKAMRQVVNLYPHTKALLVGEPDQTPESLAHYEKMQRLIVELNLTNHIIFTGFRSDVPQIMATSDFIVHSSSEPEPFGRVIVEAMAVQKPVVATAAGGVLDIVKDQETGLLVPPKDENAMAQAMLQLAGDKEKARQMGYKAQQDVAIRFSRQQHVEQIETLYRQILNP